MDDEGITFGGESLGGVVVDRGFDESEAQSAEKRQSRDPRHWEEEEGGGGGGKGKETSRKRSDSRRRFWI